MKKIKKTKGYRNLLIWQDGYEWEIRENGLESYHGEETFDIDAFGIAKQRKGKIVYLMGIGFLDKEFECIKKIKAFREVCNFTYNKTWFTKNKIQPDGLRFTCNFFKALEFTKKRFYEDYGKGEELYEKE